MGREESRVENHFKERVKLLGGFTRKCVYQGRKSAPDQWAFFPEGRLLIVECKREKEQPTELQYDELRTLRKQGFSVGWVNTKEDATKIVNDFFNPEFNQRWPL